MAFQPAPGVAQFNIKAELADEPVENVLHFWDVVNPSWSGSALSLWASIIATAWVADVMPWLSNTYQLNAVEGRDLSFEGGAFGVWTPTTTTVGEQTSAALPNNVAFVLTKRTARSGRSYRGRIYICGLTDAQVAANSVADPTAIALRAAIAGILIRDSSSTIGGVVLSRQNGGVQRLAALPTVISDITITDQFVDSQRRRLPGR